jgi:hypothetical protein
MRENNLEPKKIKREKFDLIFFSLQVIVRYGSFDENEDLMKRDKNN